MGLLEILKTRGLFENCTDEEALEQSLSTPIKVYCGFDPTADSLHLGNLLGIVVLSWFQRFGHQPVVLLGGATGRVGDPSGKSQERPLLAEDVLQGNSDSIRLLIQNIIGSGSDSTPVLVVNNYDWFKNMSFLDFLRDVGKYARVGSMLSKDSVRSRLDSESGLSFTEFSYQLLQGYDFMHLFSHEGVSVQVGGSDQWGNITAGTELIRRVAKKEGAQGLTFPLLLKSDGSKFGKSASGAVWLSREKLSPYKFYQYLLGTTDSDVIRLLKMLTFLPLEVIHQIEQDMSTPNYIPNTAQRVLAEEVTSFVHGERGLEEAVKATESLRPGNDTVLDAEVLKMASESIPQVNIDRKAVIGSMIVDVMPMSGLLPTKGATRRMIANGGVRVNNVKVESDSQTVEESDVIGGDMILLAAGKKNKLLVYLV
jgi:tyrosyl-tRNA synthetase